MNKRGSSCNPVQRRCLLRWNNQIDADIVPGCTLVGRQTPERTQWPMVLVPYLPRCPFSASILVIEIGRWVRAARWEIPSRAMPKFHPAEYERRGRGL